ncbi:MAG: YraN family protein [Candidatus Omnitrophica bacterium CG1_02_49_10]|nr:MAG: YraN family protein [Candidatus Omnitrophica bacterium CG1_02_49_10]
MHNTGKGRFGEAVAVRFLKKRGYSILNKNYRCRFGEMDIIAREGATLCFIEVKFRYDTRYGLPEESITPKKIFRLYKIADYYLSYNGLADISCRFDVVSIMKNEKGLLDIKVIKEAF